MTVKALRKEFLKDYKLKQKKKRQSFKDAKGEVWGVDISVWLHTIASTNAVSLYLHYDSENIPIDVEEAFIRVIDSRVKMAAKFGIMLTFVFDGHFHPMKNVAREARDKVVESAEVSINEYEAKCRNHPDLVNDDDIDTFVKNIKVVSKPSEQILSFIVKWMKSRGIQYYCAPFEAEWQLCQLEKENSIDAIVSVDGDCVVLGAKRLIYQVDWVKCKYEEFNQKIVLTERNCILSKYEQKYWCIIASLLGTDYIKNIAGVGPQTVKRHLAEMQLKKDWSIRRIKTISTSVSEVDTFWKKFEQAKNLLRFCPVVSKHNEIVPLFPFEGNCNRNQWKDIIGFDPCHLLPDNLDFERAKRFHDCNFITGSVPLKSYSYSRYSINCYQESINQHSPPFSNCTKPICGMPSFVLRSWLASRLGYDPPYNTRAEMLEHAQVLFDRNQVILPSNRIPKQDVNWTITEVLSIKEGEPDWQSETAFEIINDASQVPIIGDNEFELNYPRGNENNIFRAMQLVDNGNVLYESFEWQKMTTIAAGEGVIVIHNVVVPSMKSCTPNANSVDSETKVAGYDVYTTFGKNDNCLSLLPYPFSCCGCYDGRRVCSHRLSTLFVIMMMQRHTKDDCMKVLKKPSPVSIQNIPTLLDFIIYTD